jgi:hypothetical protein
MIVFDAAIRIDGQAVATKIIRNSKGPDPLPIEQVLGEKVHAPTLIHRVQQRAIDAFCCCHSPLMSLCTQIHPFFLV